MGVIRTIGQVTAPSTTDWRTPVYTGTVTAAATFSVTNGIATIVLGSTLPAIGYNGPNGYPGIPTASPASATQSQNIVPQPPLNIQGTFPAPGGQQVTLWGFTTATYFNGKKVTVIDCDPKKNSFRFYFNHANVGSPGTPTADATGKTAPSPFQHYRVVRLECGAGLGTDLIYVGDLNVSSTQYMTVLSLAGQASVDISSENIPPESIFIDTNGSVAGDAVQVSVIY